MCEYAPKGFTKEVLLIFLVQGGAGNENHIWNLTVQCTALPVIMLQQSSARLALFCKKALRLPIDFFTATCAMNGATGDYTTDK